MLQDGSRLYQLGNLIIDTAGRRIGRCAKGLVQVGGICVFAIHLHQSQDKGFRRVEGGDNLIPGDGDGGGPQPPALYLNKALAGIAHTQVGRDGGHNVLTAVFAADILGQVAQGPLLLHHGLHGGGFHLGAVLAEQLALIGEAHQLVQ